MVAVRASRASDCVGQHFAETALVATPGAAALVVELFNYGHDLSIVPIKLALAG